MKRTLIIINLVAAFGLFTAGCNNNRSDEDTRDSVAAAKAADSMLNSANTTDTLPADATATDTTKKDSLQLKHEN